MKKQLISLFFITISVYSFSQVHGFVKDDTGKAIQGAHVRWLDANIGIVTDETGHFRISISEKSNMLVFSSTGYLSDTIDVSKLNVKDHLNIVLTDIYALKEVTVTQRRLGTMVNRLAVQNVETMNANELRKAACCNLSESFETNPSVDVSYSDAATGAKQIKLLGLSGNYVQMLTENIPNLRGLSSAYGMGYIPGPWMESIQISKGTASVKTGYEAIAGQINVEYKKPQTSDKVSFNLFSNSRGRAESNADVALQLNDSLATNVLLHVSDELLSLDHDRDGYMDLPRIRQYNVANRWYHKNKNHILQAFVRGLSEYRKGGQTSGNYKIDINTQRYEFFVKNGFLFGEEHHEDVGQDENHSQCHHNQSGLGIILSGNIHNQDATYGNKLYKGNQKNIYANVIFDTEMGKYQQFSIGGSFNVDVYDEILTINSETPYKRTEYVPGVFAEYTLKYCDLSAVAGIRADYNSVYGLFVSPRLHVRYNIADIMHLRASIGKGYRAPNVLAENNYFLASNRKIKIANNLQPEDALNYGVTTHVFIPIWSGKELGLMAEWFYTHFDKQIVTDIDTDVHEVRFHNLNGKSYSSSLQFEANLEVFRGFTATLAHRINSVKTTINGELREKPLNNRSKSLVTLSYQTPLGKWQFDYTAQFNGGGRMPDPDVVNPLWGKEFKPFTIMNIQITKNFKKWSIYTGAENITDFVQSHPIIDVQNPFGENFDTAMVWGPMHGRTFYVGMRWALAK